MEPDGGCEGEPREGAAELRLTHDVERVREGGKEGNKFRMEGRRLREELLRVGGVDVR